MFTFCDVLHEAKQKNLNKLSRVRITDWKSALTSALTRLSMSFCKGLSAWPSHLARLALAISKWLCSFYHVIFLLGIYLFLLYFLSTK